MKKYIADIFETVTGLNLGDILSNITGKAKEPTGFVNPDSAIVSYNKTDRTITLTGDVEVLWRGKVVPIFVSGWVSAPHPIAVDNYYLYYNGTELVWSTDIWTFDMVQIAFVSRDGYAIKETHGLMPWQTHKEFHQINGTYKSAGGDFSNWLPNSTVATNRRPQITTTTVQDEDLATVNPALATNAYTIKTLSGVNTVNFTLGSADIVPLSTNQPYYNRWNGSAWVQTLMTNNSYQAIFIIAVPVASDTDSQKYRYLFVQGQQEGTLTVIQSLNSTSVNLGASTSLSPEFTFIGKIIIRYTAANWKIISVEKLFGTQNNNTITTQGGISNVVVSGLALAGLGIASSPLYVQQLDGFMDYNDTGANVSYTASSPIVLTNDGLGAFTLKTYKPLGFTELWNTTTNRFNFADLSIGDEVVIRVDLSVTTLAANASVNIFLTLDIGGTPYTLNLGNSKLYKTVGTYQISENVHLYVGSAGMRDNPASISFEADTNCTINMKGFYISTKRRVI